MKPFTVDMYHWHEDAFQILHTCLMHRPERRWPWASGGLPPLEEGVPQHRALLNRRYRLSEIAEAFERESPTGPQ